MAGLPSTKGPLLVGAIGCLSPGKPPPFPLYTEPNSPAYFAAPTECAGKPLLLWITDISFSCKVNVYAFRLTLVGRNYLQIKVKEIIDR